MEIQEKPSTINSNLDIYNKVKQVPQNAQKSIVGGRLKGMTDINPMWRIYTLTEQFGVCGVGWYYEVLKQWIEDGSNDEKVAFVNINLFIKIGEEWSRPIFGTGGSSFIAKERNGMFTSDECYKMALTDALSVACKSLGIGADIYWGGGRSKYSVVTEKSPAKHKQQEQVQGQTLCKDCNVPVNTPVANFSKGKYGKVLCMDCQKKQ